MPNLLLDENLGQAVKERQTSLRAVVRTAAELGIPMPGMMAALSYFDALRSDWLPANLIQAQRDYFGAHTYERIDEKGKFHTEWQATELMSPHKENRPGSTVMVIFGAGGDLAWRKLVPALYNLCLDNWLPGNFAIIGMDRRELTAQEFREYLRDGVAKNSRRGAPSDEDWEIFSSQLEYAPADFGDAQAFARLKERLDELDETWGVQADRVFYQATPPQLVEIIVRQLDQCGSGPRPGTGPPRAGEALRPRPGISLPAEPDGKDGFRRNPDLPHRSLPG